jgi:tripartite-type tricarboxylate transporter receptor subunit TctC
LKLSRRNFLHLTAGAAALSSVSGIAWAQAYPSRPVRLIVGFAAGGGYDIVARLIGQWLSERLVPGYDVTAWYGVGAPKGTPVDIIDKLNKEINSGLADPKLKARLADFGGTPLVLSPADFGKFIAQETEKWGKVIRVTNIKAD